MTDNNILTEVKNMEEFKKLQSDHPGFLTVLFYKPSSEKSTEALERLKSALDSLENIAVALINVEKTRDIHASLGVTTVPTVLTLKKGRVAKKIEGLQTGETYKILMSNAPRRLADGTEAPPLRVFVYSTPVCPHCTTVKNHLKRKGIPFRDIDVSKDQNAAVDLQRRTGQTGVPQTDINGTWVLGADLAKIDRLVASN